MTTEFIVTVAGRGFSNPCLVPNQNTNLVLDHLDGLSFNRLLVNQMLTSFRHSQDFPLQSEWRQCTYNWLSSAYVCRLQPYFSRHSPARQCRWWTTMDRTLILGEAAPEHDWWWEIYREIHSETRFSRYDRSHLISESNFFPVARVGWNGLPYRTPPTDPADTQCHNTSTVNSGAMSLNTFRSAVSVLWWQRYTDCLLGIASNASRRATIRLCTTFWIIFERKEMFDTSL